MKRPYTTGLMSLAARAVLLTVLVVTVAGCGTPYRQGTTVPDQQEAERTELFRQGFPQYSN